MSRNPKGVIVGLALVGLMCLLVSNESTVDFGNQFPQGSIEHPVMNLPRFMRQRNWIGGSSRDGSCVVASMVSLLRWQGKPALANRLKQRYGGGQDYSEWKAAIDREGIKYASTKASNEVSFLEKAVATRRGCMVGVGPYQNFKEPTHMVCLVDMTSTKVVLLDNNFPEQYVYVGRKEFLTEWERAGSWALTPVYTPTSPRLPK